MSSKVAIWNMALVNVGSSGFIQSDTEPSAEANHCRVVHDSSLKSALESLDWNFARIQVALADLGTPEVNWQYQYAYPSNCLKVRKIVTSSRLDKPLPFKTGLNSAGTQKVINTDVEGAIISFTANIENTALFPESFSQLVAWHIALGIAPALSGNDQKIFDKVRNGLSVALSHAQTVDANEGQEDDEQDAPWIKEYE